MGGYIPEEILESIRLRADIVQVISGYVNLQKRGRNYVGTCPFHQETDPSFTVTPEKQIFYCFGCHNGGNVFKFIMLQHQVSFPEAVKILGEKVGVAVPEGYSPKVKERLRRGEKVWRINALARDYFHAVLMEHPAAAAAREYLAGRGLTPEIIKRFGLGFAPGDWDALIKFMQNKGVGVRDLVEVGLAVQGERKAYDRFRSRLMFPIADIQGKVVGFGGRVLGDGTPKYLNTPETEFFSKGKVLYGLDRARQHIREAGYAIITEGYMDAITAHQFGITNTVASLGTSLTREHGRLLVNYAREIIIAYDADAAGVAATIRGLDILQELGCRIRVLSLPEGKDPDEFLRKRGVEAWRRQVETAVSLVEFKLQVALEKYKNVSTSKEAVLEEVLPSLAAMNGELEKNEAIKLVASRLYTSYHAVAEQLRRFSNNQPKIGINSDKIAKNKHNIIRKNRINFGERAEYGLLKLMLEDTSVIDSVTGALPGNFFRDSFCNKVYEIMLNIYKHPSYASSVLFDYLEEEHQQKLGMLLMEPVPGEDVEGMMAGYINAIKRRQLLEYRDKLIAALAEAEKSGNREEMVRILHEIKIAEKP
ncbi:DNA primase [Desulfallas sp. Bu1-1]|uniref:DNA primase n=1 Tax=Desulfallas sp. Bu1-1 TaxID=2787620 RepID=UPI00189E00AE|nr:DNA primase [Desulfallas sp. Bu1-1]MBF7082641.1 DNA primase [Desulfallas sp. Bu1-1]